MTQGLDGHFAQARAAEKQGDYPAAAQAYRAILARYPANGRARAALAAMHRRIGAATGPEVQAAYDAAAALLGQGRREEALAAAAALVAAHGGQTAVQCLHGAVLLGLGRAAEAEAAFRRSIALEPNPPALNDLGSILLNSGRPGEALGYLDAALALAPEFSIAHSNRGNALLATSRLDEAEAAYGAALGADPGNGAAWSNLGIVHQLRGRIEQSIAAYSRALECDPGQAEARVQRLLQRGQLCDWSAYDQLDAELAALDHATVVPAAFPVLALKDDPALQARRSAAMAAQWGHLMPAAASSAIPDPGPDSGPDPGRRIRIGYFSADMHDHPIMHLASGLFREHDRARFEVFAYSSGDRRDGVMRAALQRDVEHFHDVHGQSDDAVFALARGHALDVAVDVSGYTYGHRLAAFARRLAPVQVNYLGYPGTLAAPYIDYIVVDPVIVAPVIAAAAERAHISEKLMILPGSYQPNDNTRVIAPTVTARADFGLPESGFIFCCFNQCQKISPREFAIWMGLLAAVPGSVLWLLAASETARANLRGEAAARGIASERLVFAQRVPQAEHLARHRHADLFLDTFAYNAHTTMSDALWAGLPAVTRAGRQFAARVGASLLTAVGLPELVTDTDADYAALALALATDPARLGELRQRLAGQLPRAPLFDTAGYTRGLEAGFAAALDRARAGLPPEDFRAAP